MSDVRLRNILSVNVPATLRPVTYYIKLPFTSISCRRPIHLPVLHHYRPEKIPYDTQLSSKSNRMAPASRPPPLSFFSRMSYSHYFSHFSYDMSLSLGYRCLLLCHKGFHEHSSYHCLLVHIFFKAIDLSVLFPVILVITLHGVHTVSEAV